MVALGLLSRVQCVGKGSIAVVAKVDKHTLGVLPHQTGRDAPRDKLIVAIIMWCRTHCCNCALAVSIHFSRVTWDGSICKGKMGERI